MSRFYWLVYIHTLILLVCIVCVLQTKLKIKCIVTLLFIDDKPVQHRVTNFIWLLNSFLKSINFNWKLNRNSITKQMNINKLHTNLIAFVILVDISRRPSSGTNGKPLTPIEMHAKSGSSLVLSCKGCL